MFSDERTIVVQTSGNGELEFFVPEETVRKEGSEGEVRVTILEHAGAKWAVLPTDYLDALPVEEDRLITA